MSERVTAVAGRYRRAERAGTVALALAVALGFVALSFLTDLLGLVALAVVAVLALRTPVFRTTERTVLRADDSVAAVRERFTGPESPLLALSRVPAEEVRRTEDGVSFEVGYLFGLRSVTHTYTFERTDWTRPAEERPAGGSLRVTVSMEGRPWSVYDATFESTADGTRVDLEGRTVRRYGLNRLPSGLVLQRLQPKVYAAAGFEVERYDRRVTV